MRFTSLLALSLSFPLWAVHPVGETAFYKLDKDPKRTSSLIKSGNVTVKVPAEGSNLQSGATYEILAKYQFNLGLLGNQEGQEAENLEREFFTVEFLEQLRLNKEFQGSQFKAKHLGYADAKTLNGKFYPNCDLVLLYDFKEGSLLHRFFQGLFHALTGQSDSRPDIEDLQLQAHVYAGIPVLGGVKLDMSGVSTGIRIKAGGDYEG